MIIKSLSRRSGTRQLLNYLLKNEKKLASEKQKPIIIRHNVRARTSIDKWVKEFEQNNSLRIHKRSNQVAVYHDILSFSNKDKDHITEKTLRDIAKNYIKERAENAMVIGVLHCDKNHMHLHFCVSGTKYLTGEANRLSRAEFQRIKHSMSELQRTKYPELVNSLPRHGKAKELKELQKEAQIDRRSIARESKKEGLLLSLGKAYSKSKSLDEFLALVKSDGHEPYYRNGQLTGIKYASDIKFRLSRLGYDKDKIAMLDARVKEEKQLAELKGLREGRSRAREIADERASKSSQGELEEDNKQGRSRDDNESRRGREDEDEKEIDDRDDMNL